jgi:hypothetical protein
MEQAGIRSKFVPTVTAALALLATFTPGAAAHPVPPLPGQPEVRFCAIDQTHIPHWRDERDARITSQARAEIIAYAGNKGKWWFPLTKRSDGKTVRDLHPGVKVLQYLTPSGFNAVPTPGDPIDPPSGPTGYAHTRTLTVAEYARVARATGERVPEIRDLKPYGFPDAIAEPQWGPLMVHANPAGSGG